MPLPATTNSNSINNDLIPDYKSKKVSISSPWNFYSQSSYNRNTELLTKDTNSNEKSDKIK